MSGGQAYLFSVDLEDVRLSVPEGLRHRERVPANARTFLRWLARHEFTCTFFVVGNVAEMYPDLVREIAGQGHEIACHSLNHTPLDRQTVDELRVETERGLEALHRAGADRVRGFRAPTFSLIERTQDRYEVLAGLGFTYSSSVLPARNPLYGWPEFGPRPRRVEAGLVEIPMSVGRVGPLQLPFAGGIYFRVLPEAVIVRHFRNHDPRNGPPRGYFHPYDLDTEQERFMHPEINDNRFYNWLMFRNRDKVIARLDRLVQLGWRVMRYEEYVDLWTGSRV